MSSTALASAPSTTHTSPSDVQFHPGLAGIVLGATRLSRVDGQKGELVLAGHAVEDIAPRLSFEEMTHLLWTGQHPDAARLEALHRALATRRSLPEATVQLLRTAAARNVAPMNALAMAVASLHSAAEPSSHEEEDDLEILGAPFDDTSLRLLATMPLMVGAYVRLRGGQEPVVPHRALGQAGQLLYALQGEVPTEARVRALDTYLNTVIDHGANASTFTARVIVSTGSDLISAVMGALGALKGPLHGGAPGPALDMVFDIGQADRAEPYLRAKLGRGERLMGFGHRVYRVRDPRAAVLETAARQLFEAGDDRSLYDLATHVEKVAIQLLAEHKPERKLRTNVEFYTALLLHGIGLETELFTPLFALSRTAGWLAHADEQRREGRLIRPRLHYTGPEPTH